MRLLAPPSPVRVPAIEKDWQGLPPTSTSGLPNSLAKPLQFTLVTSPRFGTDGNLSLSTALGNASTSANASGRHPSGAHATLAASMPLNSDR